MKLFLMKLYIYLISKWIHKVKNLKYHLGTKKDVKKMWFLWERDINSYQWTQTFTSYINDYENIEKFLSWLEDDSRKIWEIMIKKIIYITFNNIISYNDIINESELREQEDFSRSYLEMIKKYNFPVDEISSYLNIYYIPKLVDIIPNMASYIDNKDVLDAWAYIWDSWVSFSINFKNINNVYCFEPVKNNYEKLKNYIDKHEVKNVYWVNKWVWDKNEILKIENGWAGSKISKDGSEEIEIITIDSYVKSNNLNVWLIKWDIEGFEYESILWTLETIKSQKPIMLISIYHRWKDFFEIKKLIEELNLWYKFKLTRWNCFHPFADLLLVCYQ